MKPTRDDLRVPMPDDTHPRWGGWRPVHDSELAAMGYVKLDVDVEALRDIQFSTAKQIDPEIPVRPAVLVGPSAEVVHDLIRQVLAALDGETT